MLSQGADVRKYLQYRYPQMCLYPENMIPTIQ